MIDIMSSSAIPEGWHTVTPLLTVHGAHKLIDFLKSSFDAIEESRDGEGAELHAEIRIGDSRMIVIEAGMNAAMPAWSYLYVADIDDFYHRAIKAGAMSLEEPQDLYYGDRRGTVRDPFGNIWAIATRKQSASS
jgi:PhnB protein